MDNPGRTILLPLSQPSRKLPSCHTLKQASSQMLLTSQLAMFFSSAIATNGDQSPSYFMKKLKPAETCYSTFDQELLAIAMAIKPFCHFVEGHTFHIVTDHKPLAYAFPLTQSAYSKTNLPSGLHLTAHHRHQIYEGY